ncbi:hypothetical protein ACWFR5_15895 [Streptomyces sp. NPDC055092]
MVRSGRQIRATLGEQARFGLGKDAQADQTLELVPGVLDGLRREREVQDRAQVAGALRPRSLGEGVEELLVGRVVRQDGRLLGRLRGRQREGEEGLTGHRQVPDFLVEFTQTRGELVHLRADLLRIADEFAFACVNPLQERRDLSVHGVTRARWASYVR